MDNMYSPIIVCKSAETKNVMQSAEQICFEPTHLSVRLHAQLSQITATVRLCYSIRQLQLSEYTCR